MAHFAYLENNIVIQVITADEDFLSSLSDQERENWKQTSYNTCGNVHYDPDTNEPSQDQSKAFRKNYAGIGFRYDPDRDAFIPPQQFPSWTLNEDTCLWEAPTPRPDNVNTYTWDEDTLSWIKYEVVIP
jgi:hypothetical protein